MVKATFFPPFLDKGSFDDPEAGWGPVRLLQFLLIGLGHATKGLVPDGVYGDETAASVVNLQRGLGLPKMYVDGNFGLVTRERLRSYTTLNVNHIECPESNLAIAFYVSPENVDPRAWPGTQE